MKNSNVISWPKILSKLPSFTVGLPALVNGLRIANSQDKTRSVGIGLCVEQVQKKHPDGIAILYEDTAISYTELNDWANRLAHYLLSTGVKKGDSIVVMIENRPELLATIIACAKIGVVTALINTSLRGKVLEYSINLVKPGAVILGEELLQAYEEVSEHLVIPHDRRYFLADANTLEEAGDAPTGWQNLTKNIQGLSIENPATTKDIYVEDPCFYIYTSGTTGMPKAVNFNHGRFMKAYGAFGHGTIRLNQADRMLVTLPFYHVTAMAVCWGSVLAGGATLVMKRKFSARQFWDDVRKYKVTAFGYVGELCRYLMDQPEKETDRQNDVRLMTGNGLRPAIWQAFKKRFGISHVYEVYGSSEGNIVFSNILNLDNTVGYCPLKYAIVKYDKENEEPVLDAKGRFIKVNKGEVGLLIGEISDKTPFDGYTDSSKTESCIIRGAFKEGDAWFNTNDLMRDMGFKHAQFVDRLGDTFRWKGENVSTTEVESIMDSANLVSESVVYGVEIPHTNGRAGMASLRLACGESAFDFKALLQKLKSELPSYALPIFLRISKEVDTTQTFKHKKGELKKNGFDLSKQLNSIYVWLPQADEYVKMTKAIQEKIEQGVYRY